MSSQEKRGKGLRAFFTHRYAQGGQNNPKIPRKENVHAKLHLRESVHLKRTNLGQHCFSRLLKTRTPCLGILRAVWSRGLVQGVEEEGGKWNRKRAGGRRPAVESWGSAGREKGASLPSRWRFRPISVSGGGEVPFVPFRTRRRTRRKLIFSWVSPSPAPSLLFLCIVRERRIEER